VVCINVLFVIVVHEKKRLKSTVLGHSTSGSMGDVSASMLLPVVAYLLPQLRALTQA
jgi:hypothetical protein